MTERKLDEAVATGDVITIRRLRFLLSPHLYDREIDHVVDTLKTENLLVIKPRFEDKSE